MEIVKLLIENPGSGIVIFLSLLSGLFYMGTIYSNLRHMQESMVTKKDLQLAIAEFSADISELYVRKVDFDKLHQK